MIHLLSAVGNPYATLVVDNCGVTQGLDPSAFQQDLHLCVETTERFNPNMWIFKVRLILQTSPDRHHLLLWLATLGSVQIKASFSLPLLGHPWGYEYIRFSVACLIILLTGDTSRVCSDPTAISPGCHCLSRNPKAFHCCRPASPGHH